MYMYMYMCMCIVCVCVLECVVCVCVLYFIGYVIYLGENCGCRRVSRRFRGGWIGRAGVRASLLTPGLAGSPASTSSTRNKGRGSVSSDGEAGQVVINIYITEELNIYNRGAKQYKFVVK